MLFTISTKPVLSVVFSSIGSTKTLLLSASVKTLKLTRLHAEIVSSYRGFRTLGGTDADLAEAPGTDAETVRG